jgi:hypothetical protein
MFIRTPAPANLLPKFALLTGLAISTFALTACTTGYHTTPDIASAKGNVHDPNLYSQTLAVTRALEWVINKYPIETPRSITRNDTEAGGKPASAGTIAVNLTEGTSPETYEKICRELSKQLGVQAVPLTQQIAASNNMPIYHIGRVWIRQQTAKIDVFRPMYDLPRHKDGTPIYQCVTVNLRGWTDPWAIDGVQTREPGAIEMPENNPIDRTQLSGVN